MKIIIDTVRVSNFRSLKNVQIKLGSLTLLVGANNAGKTTFLKALNLALGIERRFICKEDLHISKEDIAGEDKKIRIDIRIIPVDDNDKRIAAFGDLWRDVEFGDLINFDNLDNQYVSFRTEVTYNPFKNDYEIKKYKINEWKEEVQDWENVEYPDLIRSSFQAVPLFFIDAQRDILNDLKDRSSYLGKLISKIEIDPQKIEELENKIKELNEDIVGNSTVLTYLKDKLRELNNTIQSGGTGIDITPLNKKIRDLNKGLNISFQDGESESFPLEYHGMGTRSWASLLTFKSYITWLSDNFDREGTTPFHPVLALEEPEAHLHPNAQRHLYSQLAEIKGQKIISSHSPYIVGQCDLQEIRLFFKQNELLKISQFEVEGLIPEDLRKLKREIMHSRGELFFSKAIVLVEGETEEQSMPIFGKGYWGRNTFELGVNFVGVGGRDYLPFIRFCNTFNIPWFILSDGEAETIKSVKSAIKKSGCDASMLESNTIIIPNGKDYEQLLLDEGYKDEIIESIILWKTSIFDKTEFMSKQHEKAKKAEHDLELDEIRVMQIKAIAEFMDLNKTSISPIIAELLVCHEEKAKRYPSMIKGLLEKVSAELKLEMDNTNL